MFRSAARVFLQQQQHQRRIQLLLQRIHHHPDRVVVIPVRRWNSSSTEDTSDDRPSSSSSTNVILPSTDGLEEWRTKNSSSTSGSGTIDSITAEATPIFLSYQVQEMYDPEIHLPSAPIDWTGYEPSTPISDEITALIGVTGRPISMADFMRMALTHPEHGYYTKAISKQQSNRDDFDNDDHYDDDPTTSSSSSSRQSSPTSLVIGADFVTAPEVSSVFGECIGVWFVTQWNRLHQPNDWQFLELGPGKGSLMVDLLRFTRQLSSKMQQKSKNNATDASSGPMFGDGCRHIHFIEQSPVLRQRQREDLVQNFRHEIYFVFDDPEHPSDPKNPSSSFHGVASPSPKEEMNRKKHTIAVHWHDSFNAFRLWQNKQPSTTTTTTTNQQKWLPTFVIGQEFLDALPIYAFEKTEHGVWRERMVDVVLREDLNKELQEEQAEALRKDGSMPSTFTNPTTSESTNNGTGSIEINTTTTTSEETTTTAIQKAKPTNKLRLRIVLAPEATPALKMLLKTDADGKLPNDTAPAGAVVEVCPEGILLVQDVASMLEVQGGAALFIDYGSAEGSRDSLRGFSRHQQVHFLSRPGEVDITADVDFLALQHAINSRNDKIQKEKQQSMLSQQEQVRYSTKAYGPTTQGEFLMAIGIQERVINLMESESVTDQQAEDLYQALVRLASPKEMGERYKVMAIATKLTADASEDAPPGFS